MEVCVVDYSGGNIRSLCNALHALDASYRLSDDAGFIRDAPAIMLPGVGNFGSVMKGLSTKGLDSAIIDAIGSGAKFFGICVGMQVLFNKSDESPGIPGLGILKGDVLKFASGKVPQIGWNTARALVRGIFLDGYVYFVNSYYCAPKDKEIIACLTEYSGFEFCSAIQTGNIWATQFHPEKSGTFGLDILRRWIYDS